jgi:hypothetical protein
MLFMGREDVVFMTMCFIPFKPIHCWNSDDVNWGPLSVTTRDGIPFLAKIVRRTSMVCVDVVFDIWITSMHDGHLGVVKMKSFARSRVWWPGIDKDLESLAKKCEGWQQSRNMPPGAPLIVTTRDGIPFLAKIVRRTSMVCVDVVFDIWITSGHFFSTVREDSCWFRWTFPRINVHNSSGCYVKMAASYSNVKNNVEVLRAIFARNRISPHVQFGELSRNCLRGIFTSTHCLFKRLNKPFS